MKMTIVIADDSRTARFLIRQYLEMVGFYHAEFIEAENGRQALQLVKDHQANILFTDYKMPEMDGLDLLRRVKASPLLHELPVVEKFAMGGANSVKGYKENIFVRDSGIVGLAHLKIPVYRSKFFVLPFVNYGTSWERNDGILGGTQRKELLSVGFRGFRNRSISQFKF